MNDKSWSGTLDRLIYDFTDLNLWEHLLAGEPFHRRNMAGVDPSDRSTAVDTEKHLDMPASWVEKLEISADGEGLVSHLNCTGSLGVSPEFKGSLPG